jgi:hypothetical protein
MKGNDNRNKRETNVTMEVEAENQSEKIDQKASSKTPNMTIATISRVQKVKMFREAAREAHEKQAKKMKKTFSKNLEIW